MHRLQARFPIVSVFVLEGSDLSLKLVVKLPQCLMLTDGILVVDSRMLSIAIRLELFLHLLFHVSDHLKELVFMMLRWLDTGSCLLR